PRNRGRGSRARRVCGTVTLAASLRNRRSLERSARIATREGALDVAEYLEPGQRGGDSPAVAVERDGNRVAARGFALDPRQGGRLLAVEGGPQATDRDLAWAEQRVEHVLRVADHPSPLGQEVVGAVRETS